MDFYPGIFLPLKPFDLAGDLSHMVIALLKAMKEPWMPEAGIPPARVPDLLYITENGWHTSHTRSYSGQSEAQEILIRTINNYRVNFNITHYYPL